MIIMFTLKDGKPYNPPVIPEYRELFNKYPRCGSIGYKCMYCAKCPIGDNFKYTEEEKAIVERQQAAVKKYMDDNHISYDEIYIPFNVM